MTVRFDYLSAPGVMLMVYEGQSTNQQQAALFQRIVEHFGVGPFVHTITDMSKLTSSEITATDMFTQSSQVKREVEHAPEPIKQALFAPTDISYGIARMYLGFADLSPNLNIRIFDDLHAAVDWMGIPTPAHTLFGERNWQIIQDD